MTERRSVARWLVLATIGLDMFSFGMTAPVLPGLVRDLLGAGPGPAARWLGYFSALWAFLQLLCSPLLGALSDRFGRRPVIVLSNLGMGLDYVLMALAPNLRWLLIGRAVSGITAASIPTAMAYMSDVTPAEGRAVAFGRVNAALGIGFVAGPAVGGLLGAVHPRLPFWVSAALSIANALLAALFLDESLPRAQRRPIAWADLHLPRGLGQLFRTAPMARPSLALAAGFLAQQVLVSVFVLHVLQRLGWSGMAAGLLLAVYGLGSAVIGGMAVHALIGRLGESRALRLALLLTAAGYAACGLSSVGPVFVLGTLLMTFWGLATAVIQARMTHRWPADSQGRLQGSINSIRSLTALIGPLALAWVYQWSVTTDRTIGLAGGLCFVLCASLVLVALLLVGGPEERNIA